MNPVKRSILKLGKKFVLQQEVTKNEIDHEKIFENIWENERRMYNTFEKICSVFSFHLCIMIHYETVEKSDF